MKRAIIVAFHKYQPYGGEFYEPILDFFVASMKKYRDEYDTIYFVDSNWEIGERGDIKEIGGEVLRVDPSLRYYDAYKAVLPQVKGDLVLFLDNDMVIYQKGIIELAFKLLAMPVEVDDYDVVSIYDTIGEFKTDKLNGKNKFCPYFFATRKELLLKYLDVDWGPDMPYCETLGHLTEAMLKDGIRPYEFPEDKSNMLFDGSFSTSNGIKKSKNLGYYHIRAGSTPALLLAYKEHDPEKYWEYLKNQPKSEYLRQLAWYFYMCGVVDSLHAIGNEIYYPILEIAKDSGLDEAQWHEYFDKFRDYHGL